MAEFILWLKMPGRQRTKIMVEGSQPLTWLKDEILAESGLPRFGPDDQALIYRIINANTGKALADESAPISSWAKNGDQVIIQKAMEKIQAKSGFKGTIPPSFPYRDQTALPEQSRPPEKPAIPLFSLTGIPPFQLDFTRDYPVLAVIFRYMFTGAVTSSSNTIYTGVKPPQSEQKPIYVKDTFFLTANSEGIFSWVSPLESSYYMPEISAYYPEHNRRMTRYSLNKYTGDRKYMIYPVRPFSITGIEMDGFSSGKAYPVLAIDVDQYVQEIPEQEDYQEQQQPSSRSMAFFLVGDDNGEFAWIAEDECRLYPLM